MSTNAVRTVLLVDDDPGIRSIGARSLELVGHLDVTVVNSGQQALDAFAAGLRPDVVLLDMMMPGMTGRETLAKIRSIPGLANQPVIMLTARVSGSDLASYQSDGVTGVLSKPFDPMTLPMEVERIFAGRESVAQS